MIDSKLGTSDSRLKGNAAIMMRLRVLIVNVGPRPLRNRVTGRKVRMRDVQKQSEQMFGSLRKVRLDAACAFHSDTTPVVPTSADIVTTMSAQSRWRY